MTVGKAVAAEIRRLYYAEHWKRGTIAAQLGVHFDVVVRVLGSFGPEAGSPCPRARVLDADIPFSDETLSRYPRLVATRIQDMLVERGRLCGPRKPQEKGKVERAIRFLKERFFAARSFHSVQHGNGQLAEFFATIAHPRPHPRWPERRVIDVFDEERPRLLALPEPLPHTDSVGPIAVDKTAFVRLDTNRYSVPALYARRTLTLVADDRLVRLVDGANEVACHQRSWGRHQTLELPEHRAALLAHKHKARDLKGRDRLLVEVPEMAALLERWVDAGRNLGSMVRFTITMLDAYGPVVLREVIADMLARGVHDRGAMAILCEQKRKRSDGPTPMPIQLGAHVIERNVVPHDLGGYDE